MSHSLSVIYTKTQDNLRLQGMYYQPSKKTDTCVVSIHGMSGFFIENVWGDVLGRAISEAGYAFIYSHNRGYTHINDIATSEIKSDNGFETKRHGAIYERFESCVFDIDAWINHAQKLGYKKLILLGHSLGCPKLIHWYSKRHPSNLAGFILASPPDMVGLIKKPHSQPNYSELLVEAKALVSQGKYSQILSQLIWNWYMLSAQTFLDLFSENGPADIIPIYRNPEKFELLSQINIPILSIMGEHDDVIIRSATEDLTLLKSKATSCPDFQTTIIAGANHNYENREADFSKVILNWLKHTQN